MGSPAGNSNTIAIAANTWYYVLARFITAGRRMHLFTPSTGVIAHIAPTVPGADVVCDTISIGGNMAATPVELWGGQIGEIWLMQDDICPDSAANPTDDFISNLARHGPLYAAPHKANRLVMYHSLRRRVDRDETGLSWASRPTRAHIMGRPSLATWSDIYPLPGPDINRMIV